MMRTFTLRPGLTTRQVNDNIRTAMHDTTALYAEWFGGVFADITPSVERRRATPWIAPGVRADYIETRYVFGLESRLRATMVGHYIVGTGEVGICFPNDYRGWDRANLYDRLRVGIYDRIVHGVADHPVIIDTSIEARVA